MQCLNRWRLIHLTMGFHFNVLTFFGGSLAIETKSARLG
jgi:hypothetical protein